MMRIGWLVNRVIVESFNRLIVWVVRGGAKD